MKFKKNWNLDFLHKIKWYYLVLTGVLLFVIFFFLLSGKQILTPSQEKLLVPDVCRIHLSSSVQSLDPAFAQSDAEIMIARLVFRGLVSYNARGELQPDLAKSWEISPNQLTYTFYLHEEAYFHNGRRITAGDVKFTLERVLRVNAPTAYILANIVGAEDVLSGKVIELSGIEATDDYTLKITLKRPQPQFLTLLAQPAASILDRYELVEQGVDYGKPGAYRDYDKLFSGTGPYLLTEWLDNEKVVLGINDQYYGEKPYLQRIEFVLNLSTQDALAEFTAGHIDIVQSVLESDWNQLPSILRQDDRMVEEVVRVFRYVAMNSRADVFTDSNLRLAILAAIDGDAALASARGEEGVTNYPYISEYWRNLKVGSENKNPAHLLEAKQYLQAAGYGEGGKTLPTLTLYCGSTQEDIAAANSIAGNLRNLGFGIQIQSLSYRDLRRAIRSGEAAFYTSQFADKGGGLDVFFSEVVDANWQGVIGEGPWTNLLNQAYAASEDNKIDIFKQVEEQLANYGILRSLYANKTSILVNYDRWTNFIVTAGGSMALEELQPNRTLSE